ncbi:MAG: RNA polymerase subunit sigma, partial [Opitutaceae bacterium]|nr:RNA polymerase subunit sigma [Opitutaceae bacterium]
RHGGGQRPIDLDGVPELAAENPDNDGRLLAVDEALERFAALEPQRAQLVKLRFFVGLTLDEASQVLGISESTAKRWWAFARAWLYRDLDAD